MDCFLCNKVRSSKYWSPSQWARYSCAVEGLVGCKVCRGWVSDPDQRAHHGSDSTGSTTPTAVPAELMGGITILRSKIKFMANNVSPIMGRFIVVWMEQLPHDYRKQLSHHGLIRNPLVPPHVDETQTMFDPGNRLYAYAFCLVPTFASLLEGPFGYDWIDKTLGHIYLNPSQA